METAIYYESDGYKIGENKVMGRQVAGNSFLKAYIKYTKLNEFWVYTNGDKEAKDFADFVRYQKESLYLFLHLR